MVTDLQRGAPASTQSFLDRTQIIVGERGMRALAEAHVAVYGLGGVGAACALDMVRVGVGHLRVVDFDTVEPSNLNRLAFGLQRYVGWAKTDAFADIAHEINPHVEIECTKIFFSGDAVSDVIARDCSVHADCIDSVGPKVNLIAALRRENLIFISSMGTAGRLMPERLRLGSMASVKGCPLARAVRQKLSKREIPLDFPVVWSDEPAVKPLPREGQRGVQGSTPFVPQTAGHFMASWIVRFLLSSACNG